jgi:hypothetical protein
MEMPDHWPDNRGGEGADERRRTAGQMLGGVSGADSGTNIKFYTKTLLSPGLTVISCRPLIAASLVVC